ncbi:hypothetical protein PV08_06300 [Exophiala spinifera]|uniref:Uncharacterized protein n=1 Tax=Exophiala spinifera TaxID=91928 RepID=A0A0D2BY55_9EURO|nr:uncharacterized protein PV08_06300 [Exophiala spinifera]KIW16249.1 hypothetical protein PV08_06300 [Exophiala spinifera]
MRHLLSPALRRARRASQGGDTKRSESRNSEQLDQSMSHDSSACSAVLGLSNRRSFALPSVPSSPLLLEEMFKLWPSETVSDATIQSVSGTVESKQGTSVTIVQDSGVWDQDLHPSREASSPLPELHPTRLLAQFSTPLNRPATPVPSLTFSQISTCSRSSREVTSSSPDQATRSSVVHGLCLAKTSTIGLEDNEMLDPFYTPPRTSGNRSAKLATDDFPPYEAFYVNPWTGGYAGAIAPSTQPRHVAPSAPEISYIDWDDEDAEHTHRLPTAIARIRKSLADLRTADRFTSSRKASTRTQDSSDDAVPSIPRPATADDGARDVKCCSPTKITHGTPDKTTLLFDKALPPLPNEQLTTTCPEPTDQCSRMSGRSTEAMSKRSSRSLPSSFISANERRRTIDSELEGPDPSSPVAFQHIIPRHNQSPRSVSPPKLRRRESSNCLCLRSDRLNKSASVIVMEKWLRSPFASQKGNLK